MPLSNVDAAILQALATYVPKSQIRAFRCHPQRPFPSLRLVRTFVFVNTACLLSIKDTFQRTRTLLLSFDDSPITLKPGKSTGTKDEKNSETSTLLSFNPPSSISADAELFSQKESIGNLETPELPGRGSGSMSRRRLASNIPTLQRHLSFKNNHQLMPSSNLPSPFCNLKLDSVTTPADQIIHTPTSPPTLFNDANATLVKRAKLRTWKLSLHSPVDRAASEEHYKSETSPLSSPDIDGLASLTSDFGRRLSLTPRYPEPEGKPVIMKASIHNGREFFGRSIPLSLSPSSTSPLIRLPLFSPFAIHETEKKALVDNSSPLASSPLAIHA